MTDLVIFCITKDFESKYYELVKNETRNRTEMKIGNKTIIFTRIDKYCWKISEIVENKNDNNKK